MPLTSIGDLAQTFVNRRANARLNQELGLLAKELTTGLVADPRSAAAGNASAYSALERGLSITRTFTGVAKETRFQADGLQIALRQIDSQVDLALPGVLKTAQSITQSSLPIVADDSAKAFEAIVSTLNGSTGNRQNFSGTTTGTVPLRSGDLILSDIRALVSGATEAADVILAIDQYFAAGGAFDTVDYLGSATDLAPVEIAPNERVSLDVRADDDVFRQTLASLAKAAMLGQTTIALDRIQSEALASNAAGQLLTAKDSVTDVRARVGSTEARIDAAITQLASEDLSLQQARLDLIGADPFDTATRLEQTQLQLEQLYTLTARLSRLSLTNYI
ncbi:hypothetical protein ILP92_01740 [Maribius pontilimi]|uniref:Flagellin C-terminal domain-containing protein n=1 Tax=Palleronia pontilimi TaxID=1964209 RepID=A0A934IEN0_9RHOB|nr:flagellin [Palleronia pontilimi]MBJ3761473.1 hypothetical protein [Palleronia pontilimi]